MGLWRRRIAWRRRRHERGNKENLKVTRLFVCGRFGIIEGNLMVWGTFSMISGHSDGRGLEDRWCEQRTGEAGTLR